MPAKGDRPRPSSTSSINGNKGKKGHFRIVVLGPAGVGKTCIISRFLYERFHAEYQATVEDMHRGEYEINGAALTLDILDTAGSYEFPAMRKLSISTGDAFVLVYSVDDQASFEEVEKLREQIIEQKNDPLTPIVIVGNKADVSARRRAVHKETAESTVSIEWGNGYVEASAKENVNIVGIFKELLLQAKTQYALSPAVRRRRESLPAPTPDLKISSPKSGKRNSCSVS